MSLCNPECFGLLGIKLCQLHKKVLQFKLESHVTLGLADTGVCNTLFEFLDFHFFRDFRFLEFEVLQKTKISRFSKLWKSRFLEIRKYEISGIMEIHNFKKLNFLKIQKLQNSVNHKYFPFDIQIYSFQSMIT